jgi:hypothetical protein
MDNYTYINEDFLDVDFQTSELLLESASTLLYHFISFDRFESIADSDAFTPSPIEKNWHNGMNTMSLSRTKTFREGWPVIMYSGDDGKGDDWCAIRLTIDGDMLNRKSNFKVDGKRYSMIVKPFDWAFKEHKDGDPFDFADEHNGIFARNGKEWMSQSDDYTGTYLPINYGKKGFVNGVGDKQGHPYSQAEDRLLTYAYRIPNASQFIIRVDILLLPYAFNEDNLEDRKKLYEIITTTRLSNKIHVYDKMKNLELNRNEITDSVYVPYIDSYMTSYALKRLLNRKTAHNYKNPVSFQSYIHKDF